MSGKRVKGIRKMIYGDMAGKKELSQDEKTGVLYADSLRQRYQMAKGRKVALPKMGTPRAGGPKRAKLKRFSSDPIEGAFGKVNRMAGIKLDMRSKRKKERDASKVS